MERYLLFDGRCAKCNKLAKALEKEVNGWFVANNIRETEMLHYLNRANPNWQLRPTLLEIENYEVKVFTGLTLVKKLLQGLGIKKTIRIASLIHQMETSSANVELSRRRFLGQGSAIIGSLVILGLPRFNPLVNRLMLQTNISDWDRYVDGNQGFSLEYPSEWQVKETINEATASVNNEVIIKRVIFSAPYGLVYIDAWLANGHNLETWLKWYADTRFVEGMATAPNATLAGHSALMFIERGSPDMLVSFVSDGQHVYRLMNLMTSTPEALEAYWHMVDTFTPVNSVSRIAGIAPVIKEEAEQLAKLNGLLVANCCGYTSSGNPFPCCTQGNCTWWAYYKMGSVPFTGNAGTWWGQVPNFAGWGRSGTPPTDKPFIAWKSGSPGHVAHVASYSGSGNSLNVSHMSCDTTNWNCVKNESKTVSYFNGFIYKNFS